MDQGQLTQVKELKKPYDSKARSRKVNRVTVIKKRGTKTPQITDRLKKYTCELF